MVESIQFGNRGYQPSHRRGRQQEKKDEDSASAASETVDLELADLDIDGLLTDEERTDLTAIARSLSISLSVSGDSVTGQGIEAMKIRLALDKYRAKKQGLGEPHLNLAWLNRLEHEILKQGYDHGLDQPTLDVTRRYLIEKARAMAEA